MRKTYPLFFLLLMLAFGCSTEDNVAEEPIQAVNDSVKAIKSTQIRFKGLTLNDELPIGTRISEIASSDSSADIKLDENSNIIYNPPADFVGTDSFEYIVCSGKQCDTATVNVEIVESINLNIPENLSSYYSGFSLSEDEDLNLYVLSELTKLSQNRQLEYFERHDYLYDADEDLEDPENVILVYSGESRYWKEYQSSANDYEPQSFNTEHIYPKSLLNTEAALADLHHLRVADYSVNTKRSNNPFTDGSGSYELVNGTKWYPGDEWKGDVARMIMYVHVRYGEDFDSVGGLDLFLEWNREDPVSAFEIQRNNVIEAAQGNRNPFIDNPYLATLIWGGEAAENPWK